MPEPDLNQRRLDDGRYARHLRATMLDALPELPTRRLVLREVRAEDAPGLFAIFSNEEVVRYWSHSAYTSLSDAERLIASIHANVADHALYEWVSTDADGAVVGTVTLSSLDFRHRRAEIGFSLGREYWGRGYATEAVEAMIAFAFGRLGLGRLEADVDPDNTRSLALLRRLGFVREGFLPARYRVGGGVQHTVLLGLLAENHPAPEPQRGVRPMISADRARVVELLAAQLAEHDIALDAVGIETAVDGLLAQPDRGAILVADEGTIIGVAYVAFTWTLEHGGRVAWLEELYVTPPERGRGVGTRLLDAAIEYARREGARAVDLEVDADHVRAARLYERRGFKELLRRRWQRSV